MQIFQQPPIDSVLQLLAENDLPVNDVDEMLLAHFFGLGDKRQTLGVAGIEFHGDYGLLRSLAVAGNVRRKGYGRALVQQVEDYAREKQVHEIYLLTETAAPFFRRRGYEAIARENVPEAIRQTTEYSSLCAESALVMKKNLDHLAFFCPV